MKYEFIGKDDTVTLKYKDKQFEFKTDIKLISEIQSLPADARLMMIDDLSAKGRSMNDYIIFKEEKGKKIEDRSNLEALEEIYQQKYSEEFFQRKCKELFNMSYEELFNDIGLSTEDEGMKFSLQFLTYMSGNFPSKKNVSK